MSFITSHFPVFHEDVFLKLRPFPAEPKSLFQAHWHEALFSLVFYSAIQVAAKPVFTKWLGSTYTSLPTKRRTNFDIHAVSSVQCIVSLFLLVPQWNHPLWANRLTDPETAITGYYPYGGLVLALTVGYFVWDLYVCLRYYTTFGFGFLFHGVAALYVFGITFYPFCIPWVPAFLLFELSTPFVNVNWYALRLPEGTINSKVVLINGLLLLLTFFTVRIIWGFYAVSSVAYDLYQAWDKIDVLLPAVTVLSLNMLLNILNVFWFYKMVLIAVKKSKGARAKKD